MKNGAGRGLAYCSISSGCCVHISFYCHRKYLDSTARLIWNSSMYNQARNGEETSQEQLWIFVNVQYKKDICSDLSPSIDTCTAITCQTLHYRKDSLEEWILQLRKLILVGPPRLPSSLTFSSQWTPLNGFLASPRLPPQKSKLHPTSRWKTLPFRTEQASQASP